MMHEITYLAICACGAYSIEVEGQTYHMSKETWDKEECNFIFEPKVEIEHGNYGNCNHCVNHWGIDLCACGSGEKPSECENGLSMCGTPYQELGVVQDSKPLWQF